MHRRKPSHFSECLDVRVARATLLVPFVGGCLLPDSQDGLGEPDGARHRGGVALGRSDQDVDGQGSDGVKWGVNPLMLLARATVS